MFRREISREDLLGNYFLFMSKEHWKVAMKRSKLRTWRSTIYVKTEQRRRGTTALKKGHLRIGLGIWKEFFWGNLNEILQITVNFLEKLFVPSFLIKKKPRAKWNLLKKMQLYVMKMRILSFISLSSPRMLSHCIDLRFNFRYCKKVWKPRR